MSSSPMPSGSGRPRDAGDPGLLPGIARQLLGEELLLPALPTWWCGEAAAWHDVRAQLDDKMVRSSFPRSGRASMIVRPDDVSIDDDPDAWTVTERVRFSRAPVWSDGTILARPAMVRVYAIAEQSGQWHVLPGGMTRVEQARGRQRVDAARRHQPGHLGAAPTARSTASRCCRSRLQRGRHRRAPSRR